jgi:hypothetical protein
MTLRRPRTATKSTALPSLAALIASGVVVDGCDSSAESAERQRRLAEHGQQAGRELEGHQPGRAAREVAIGLGLLTAPTETRIQSPGEGPAVVVEPHIETAGVPAPISPTPQVLPPTPVDVDGGIRHVDPTPPPPHRPPHRVQPRMQPRGGAPRVLPQPGDPDLTGG